MSKMTAENIKPLFKKLDDLDFWILHLFREDPATRYQILMKTKPPGKKIPQIPRSTLYRRINKKLIPLGFLEEIAEEPFESGSLKFSKPVLSLTIFKGVSASLVHKKLALGALEGWFKWLLQFNMDLSEVNVDSKFYMWTILFAVSEHPEWFPPELKSIGEEIRKDFEKPNEVTMQLFRKGFIEAYEEQKHHSKF